MGAKGKLLDSETMDGVEDISVGKGKKRVKSKKAAAKEHKQQLQSLQEKDPEFYQFLRDHDTELLDFNDEDIEDDVDANLDDEESKELDETLEVDTAKEVKELTTQKAITAAIVDSWCKSIREESKLGAVRSLLRAYRTACHYGDDTHDDPSTKFSVMSSAVFNKIMIFVLSEMDGILRKLLRFPATGGKKEMVLDLITTRPWKNYNHLVKSYLGNSLHVLNQMTDTEMISFTLRRLKYSSLFLVAFPSLLRKYIKVALHFWGTGGGALPIVSLLFLRDLCVRLGSDCIDDCIKGMYKAYVLNCHFVNPAKLQHIQFLSNCVIELMGVDPSSAYQHAFVFIRQLAMILREALNMKTKEAFRKVYEWKYINCLELWTGAVCSNNLQSELRPVAYPLAQIISGVARLVPSARHFPLRLRCVRMLNRIAASTGTFIPVSMLLLDMLDMKELNKPPTGGVGKSVDLRTIIKVSKPAVKTRAFQEACVYSVVEEIAEHLDQWSYSVAFFELSFITTGRLRNFCKATKAERFRKEMKQLICQIEANSEFVNKKRASVEILPNDPANESLLKEEKKLGTSPLSQYAKVLRQRAQQRAESLVESDVIVGESRSVFGKNESSDDEDDEDSNNDKGAAVFSSSWLPGKDSKEKVDKEENKKKNKKKRKRKTEETNGEGAGGEDVVEDLVLSSDEDDDLFNISSEDDEDGHETAAATTTKKSPKNKKDQRIKSKKFSKKGRKTQGNNSSKKRRQA